MCNLKCPKQNSILYLFKAISYNKINNPAGKYITEEPQFWSATKEKVANIKKYIYNTQNMMNKTKNFTQIVLSIKLKGEREFIT